MARGSLLLALIVAGCSPPPAPPAAAPPPASSAEPPPATYAFSFRYEPSLALLIQRNGEPFEGDASLLREAAADKAPPLRLSFSRGQASFSREQAQALSNHQGLALEIEDRTIPIPSAGATNPFACHLSLEALRSIDACAELPPPPDVPLDHCDSVGEQLWSKLRGDLIEQTNRCWSSLDDATTSKLARLPASPATAYACARLVALAGESPSLDLAVKLAPRCLQFFPEPRRQQIDDEAARRSLPERLAAVRAGQSEQMHEFHARYRALAPAQAEEIRRLAAQRFGPPEPARWLALRAFVESLKQGDWRATLCDLQKDRVDVAIQLGSPPRYASLDLAGPDPDDLYSPQPGIALAMAPPGDPLVGVSPLGLVIDPGYSLRQRERLRFEQALVARVKARTRVDRVQVYSQCLSGKHWYFAETNRP